MSIVYEFETNVRPFYRNDYDVEYDCDYVEWEYDPSYKELVEFYMSLSKDVFVDACEHAFSELKEDEKAFFLNPDNGYAVPETISGDKFNWEAVYEDVAGSKDDFISELLFDDMDYLEAELHEWFYDAAYDEYKDSL